ncbi:MAG: stage II sporulation protein M [Candidatus Aenigmarchaeota archaeon]|nr:stage II sporulation protein M [Candidatus Aenigmarchaeota archaeon]
MPRRKTRRKASAKKTVPKINSFVSNLSFLYRNAKKEIWLMSVLFIIGMVLPLFLPVEQKAEALSSFSDKKEIFSFFPDKLLLFFLPAILFLNNSYVSVLSFIFGFLSPYLIFNNGFIVGSLFDALSKTAPAFPNIYLLPIVSVLPHAWLEIPAFILAAAYGLRTWEKIAFSSRIEPKLSRLKFFFKYIEPLFKAVVPMLIAAALIETYVSGVLGAVIPIIPEHNPGNLTNLLLTQQDLASAGFNLNKTQLPSIFSDVTSMYSKSFPEALKIESRSQRDSNYFSNKNTTLLITVVKTDEAEKLVQLRREIALFKLSFYKNHTLEDFETYSLAKTDKKLYYFSFTTKNDYAVLITLWSTAPQDFQKIIELQRGKLT